MTLSVSGAALYDEGLKMPDRDRFENTLAQVGRKLTRLTKGGTASEAEIADAWITAIAHLYRTYVAEWARLPLWRPGINHVKGDVHAGACARDD